MTNFMRKNIETFLGITAVFLLTWPLLDLAVIHVIAHTAFQYSVVNHVIAPILFAGLYTLFDMVTRTEPTEDTGTTDRIAIA